MDNVIHLSVFNKGICGCCISQRLHILSEPLNTIYNNIILRDIELTRNNILVLFESQLFRLVGCSISF